MPNIKRITDLTDYKSVLPYASEIFGVYQPLIGWKSKRKLDRVKQGVQKERDSLLSRLGRNLENKAAINFNEDCFATAPDLRPAGFAGPRLVDHDSIVLQQINALLKNRQGVPRNADEWKHIVNQVVLTNILKTTVMEHYNQISIANCQRIAQLAPEHETREEFQLRKTRLKEQSQQDITSRIGNEAVIAGAIQLLVENGHLSELNSIFYTRLDANSKDAFFQALDKADMDFSDPYLTFDPKKDVKDVSLSPLGIVHLYRQYFFELDTFLGTPTGHVWMSPGSTVELIEVSTRKTITEKTVETSLESVVKSEKSTTDQDEISEAVKQDNKDDLKLGVTSTVNQSWGTGSASATASLNMDKTQQVARETTHKKMRQQTEKLSTEIRQNYKSTFKTTTEVTDTSSKRYVLANNTDKLINYELRRKMRQVGVQVQDIGSYLSWETFVDEPGTDLGLANLIHIAQPADLLPVPDQTEIPYPSDQVIAFRANASWNFSDKQWVFAHLTTIDPPPPPEGLEVVKEQGMIPLSQISASGEDFTGVWTFGARFTPDGRQLDVGVLMDQNGLLWDKRVDFVVGGALRYTATRPNVGIDAANNAKKLAGQAATAENARKTKETFINAAKERIELAGSIVRRKSEDLREEERIIVYRRLIASLMTSYQYQHADDQSRHVLSELINAIFDTDKMLYFVAPEWWKPREHATEYLSLWDLQSKLSESIVTWSDSRPRSSDNYLITEKSATAVMGSSLGWLLQLDGDDLRNAFLNAPWVKAVIPIRPGKEQAAINWLQNVMVEGSDGLDAAYAAPDDELEQIRTGLGLAPDGPVTINDAINYLCIVVAEKYTESNQVKMYPDTEINVDNKVASTPVEKVYEHGFYPLQGGFRVNPNDPDPDPNNKDKNFQIFDQWIEVLPTDQVVPVEVTYDPKTGRQL